MAAVEGVLARLVAVAGPVGAVGPPAGAQAGRVSAGAAQPQGGTAGGGAAGQGQQRQQQRGGTARHGGPARPEGTEGRLCPAPVAFVTPRLLRGEGAGPPPPRPGPAAVRGRHRAGPARPPAGCPGAGARLLAWGRGFRAGFQSPRAALGAPAGARGLPRLRGSSTKVLRGFEGGRFCTDCQPNCREECQQNQPKETFLLLLFIFFPPDLTPAYLRRH